METEHISSAVLTDPYGSMQEAVDAPIENIEKLNEPRKYSLNSQNKSSASNEASSAKIKKEKQKSIFSPVSADHTKALHKTGALKVNAVRSPVSNALIHSSTLKFVFPFVL